MAHVRFDVRRHFDAPARAAWDELVDWEGHAEWIPATRVELGPGDPTAVGSTFTAWTGVGPLALEDRMRVAICEWDEEADTGRCEVEKLGPVLAGSASFTVVADADGSAVHWVEDVTVPVVPQFLAPVVGRLGALGFAFGMRRLGQRLAARPGP